MPVLAVTGSVPASKVGVLSTGTQSTHLTRKIWMSSSDDVFYDGHVTSTIGSPVTPASPPVDLCVRRLQKSVSDPTDLRSSTKNKSASEGLEKCFSLLSILGCKFERVTSLVRNMPGTCRGCHGLTGSEHVGSRWGFAHCTLLHNDDCKGGITEITGERNACPVGFIPKSTESGNETDVSQQRFSDLSDDSEGDPDYVPASSESKNLGSVSSRPGITTSSNLVFSTPATFGGTQNFSLLGAGISSLQSGLTVASSLSVPLMSTGLHPLTSGIGGAASSLLQGGGAHLGQQQVAGLTQNSSELSQSLFQQFLNQTQALQLQQQQQQQMLMQENQRVMEEMKVAVEDARRAARSAASCRKKDSSVSFSDTVVSEAEKLKAHNTKEPGRKTRGIGKDMNDVRTTPGLRDDVEEFMENSVYVHPSLSRTPTAMFGAAPPEPDNTADALIAHLKAQLAEKQQSLESLQLRHPPPLSKIERRAAKKAAAEQEAAAIKVKRKAAADKLAAIKADARRAKKAALALGVTDVSSCSDSSTESDDERDLDRTLTKAKKFSKKSSTGAIDLSDSSDDEDGTPNILTDKAGRAFKVVGGKLEALPTYVKDPVSGRMVRTTPSASHLKTSSSSESSDEQAAKKKKDKKEKQKAKRRLEKGVGEKGKQVEIHGITPLVASSRHLPPVPNQHETKGKSHDSKDKEAILSVVDWAKMCPIKYASTCNTKNMNLPVFMWAKLAEIRALFAGAMQTKLKPGELDARLRHLQCVLELVGTNSILSEYTGYGWQLGRDYDRKVQATMDSGASDWVDFNSMFSLGPHPSFVLSAKDEVEKVAKKRPNQVDEDPTKVKKKVCYKFNSCRTAKRCDWELENPNSGRCKRLHQCSYCKVTHNKSVFHQAWDCPAGGKEAVVAGTHSM